MERIRRRQLAGYGIYKVCSNIQLPVGGGGENYKAFFSFCLFKLKFKPLPSIQPLWKVDLLHWGGFSVVLVADCHVNLSRCSFL